MNKKEIENREKYIAQLEQEMFALESDVEVLDSFYKKLKEIQERQEKLMHYYYGEERNQDLKIEKKLTSTYGLFSEDGLYNLFYEIDQQKLKILKFLVEKL